MITNKTLKELIENAKKTAELQSGKPKEKKEESIEDIFKGIDKKYGISDDKPYAPTDEEIRKEAESGLTEEYKKSLDKIISQNASGGAAASESKAAQAEKLSRKASGIESAYREMLNQTKNKAIKQGIARSSIYEGSRQYLEEQKSSGLRQAENDFAEAIRRLDLKIADLNRQMEDAIADLNDKHAGKINKQIEKLTQQRDKQIEEYIKRAEAEDKKTLLFRQEEKLAAAKKYYADMPGQQALEDFLANDKIKEWTIVKQIDTKMRNCFKDFIIGGNSRR